MLWRSTNGMMSAAPRLLAAHQRTLANLPPALQHLDGLINANRFCEAAREEFMSSSDLKRWRSIVQQRAALDEQTADAYANALRTWAMERGVSNWAHLWHPMGLNCRTGGITRKFIKFSGTLDEHTYQLRGKDLLRGETDGSSFPTGGLRGTHRAGGYLSFDYTVDPFVVEDTVFLPTVFTSFEGDAIDEKTPLLRSVEAMNTSGSRLLKLLGVKCSGVSPEVGVEQEYFLVPFEMFEQRPDLILTGRTLLGAHSNKGQELSQHYMGEIRPAIRQVCIDFEDEMWKLGVEVTTRHTEVAPSQFEVAPIFAKSNRAFEENMLMMSVLSTVAAKNNMACLLHEKPFQGVNGSGKHNNYSFSTFEGQNLLSPGKTESENELFIIMLSACVRAFDKYSDVMRAAVAVPGNDFRLGACEAPPGIISVYTGDELYSHLQKVAAGGPLAGYGVSKRSVEVGIPTVASLPMPVDDRNRTSPLPYVLCWHFSHCLQPTASLFYFFNLLLLLLLLRPHSVPSPIPQGGNRFEFRAVGSSQSVASVQAYMTTAIADSLDYIADEIEKRVKGGAQARDAAAEVVRGILRDHDRIIFNGDGYSEEWRDEAARRGLENISNSVDAIKNLTRPKNVELFERTKVLSPKELAARRSVLLSHFSMTLEIEAQTTVDMVRQLVLPAALEQQERLASAINEAQTAGVNSLGSQRQALTACSEEINSLLEATSSLEASINELTSVDCEEAKADFARDHLYTKMEAVRTSADKLERIVDRDLWKLPTYEDMLFHTRIH